VFREFRGFERRRMNLSDDRGAARAVFFLVVEEAGVVFPARAEIDRKITANTPVITYVPGKPLIVVSAMREPVRRRAGDESVWMTSTKSQELISQCVLRIAPLGNYCLACPRRVLRIT